LPAGIFFDIKFETESELEEAAAEEVMGSIVTEAPEATETTTADIIQRGGVRKLKRKKKNKKKSIYKKNNEK